MRRWLIAVITLVVLYGCGYKGDLYLPDESSTSKKEQKR
ncbi:LPS translocon maturation chaperone LptM [Magnetococcus marinus]|nr:lipoprotein [Magnetococcus marinus]